MDLCSINILHYGQPKTWYAVPQFYSKNFEELTQDIWPKEFQECPAFLRHKNFIMHPSILENNEIPYFKTEQKEREIILIFAKVYHMGFSHGFNIAESCNWANEDWVEFGKNAVICKCKGRNEISRTFPMKQFVKKYGKN